jgi:hypothetical protein
MLHSRPAHPVCAYRPSFEVLEARALLSTCLVNRLTDNNPGGGGEGSETAPSPATSPGAVTAAASTASVR